MLIIRNARAPPPAHLSISPQGIEKRKKSRSAVKSKLNEWHDGFVHYVPKPIEYAAGKAFLRAKNSILGLNDSTKNTLKGGVRNQKQTEDNTNLTTHDNESGPGDDYTRGICYLTA